MKKLFALIAVSFFAAAAVAQETRQENADNPAADHPAGHECYMMKDNALMHCMGTHADAQKMDVKLENGTVITRDGKLVTPGKESVALKNGQCVDLAGMVGDCVEMHKGMMKEDGMKKEAPDKM